MRSFIAAAVLSLSVCSSAMADETTGEKVDEKSHDMKRSVNEGAHRVEETACTGPKAECAKKKAHHRGEETIDSVGDKADEVKNKVD